MFLPLNLFIRKGRGGVKLQKLHNSLLKLPVRLRYVLKSCPGENLKDCFKNWCSCEKSGFSVILKI